LLLVSALPRLPAVFEQLASSRAVPFGRPACLQATIHHLHPDSAREVLSEIPCYCGCGPMGHDSNHACYVSGENDDGSPIIDGHALGCSICVDITQDTMRLLAQGKSVPEIRAYVDDTYSQYGPSNMP
jgi:hypothetical protein